MLTVDLVFQTLDSLIQGHAALLWGLGTLSLLTFLGSLIAIPLLVVRIPADYFAHIKRHPLRRGGLHPFLQLLSSTLKNLLGLVFVLAGLAMLVLPGQGILTILIGVTLMNFPGKYTLERRLVCKPAVFTVLNRIRRRCGREPLQVSECGPAPRSGCGLENKSP